MTARHNLYKQWIQDNYPTGQSAYGNCATASKSMRAAFPELRITNGFLYDAMWGERAHWWLVAPDGAVVDPTRSQFPCPMDYIEISDNHPERKYPKARCYHCGEYYYVMPELKGTMHTIECQNAYINYLNRREDY